MATVTLCELCRQELTAVDQVVAAARQIEVTNQGSTGHEYFDGPRVLCHVRDWSRSPTFREVYRGPLSGALGTGR